MMLQVGTGLGPTLEFYALVSRELQRSDLELWSGSHSSTHAFSPTGLFPGPLGRNTKVSQTVRVRSKFRFLGKFMAKAVMDSRMVSKDTLYFILSIFWKEIVFSLFI